MKRPLLIFVLFVLLGASFDVSAAPDTKREPFDAGELIIGKVLDSHEWNIAKIGDTYITIPLPVILFYEGKLYVFLSSKFNQGKSSHQGFMLSSEGSIKSKIVRASPDGLTPDPNPGLLINLSITKVGLSVIIISLLLCIVLVSVGNSYKKASGLGVPKGLARAFEPIVEFVRKEIALSAIGKKHYKRFLPYLLSLFFFIFFANLFSLLPFFPGGANVTGNISVTLVLALFTFFTTQIFATKGYWKHIFNTPGVPVFLKMPIPLMPIIEVVGVIVKPFVLMIRLFANMTAGQMSIFGFLCLIFVLGNLSTIMGYAISPISLFFLVFMNFLKILVAFLQAYVFTLFSALFFGMAVPDDDHH